jgi:hypothetical protein
VDVGGLSNVGLLRANNEDHFLTLIDLVLATPDIVTRLDDHFRREVLRRFERRFGRIAEVLAERARREPQLAGMATTLTAACSAGPICSSRTSATRALT